MGFFASDKAIRSYHFGSETLMGHSGWVYQNRWSYVAATLTPSIVLFFGASYGIVGIKQNSIRKCGIASLLTMSIIGALVWFA